MARLKFKSLLTVIFPDITESEAELKAFSAKYLEYPILQVQVKTTLELTFVLIQPFCLYYVNNVFLMLTSIFKV